MKTGAKLLVKTGAVNVHSCNLCRMKLTLWSPWSVLVCDHYKPKPFLIVLNHSTAQYWFTIFWWMCVRVHMTRTMCSKIQRAHGCTVPAVCISLQLWHSRLANITFSFGSMAVRSTSIVSPSTRFAILFCQIKSRCFLSKECILSRCFNTEQYHPDISTVSYRLTD